MKPKKTFRPQTLRGLLITLLILVAVAGGGLFYLGLNYVREYAVEVNHRLKDAEASATQIDGLRALRSQLNESNSLVEKANSLFATPASYQTQALNDVNNYAAAAGLSVASTNFGDPAATGQYSISVNFREPVSFTKLIHFLDAVESNLPKMQVSSIVLGRGSGVGADTVKVGEIKIDISVR